MQKFRKRFVRIFFILIALYLLLLIPDSEKHNLVKAVDKPFAWNQDSVWSELEIEFKEAKDKSKSSLDSGIQLLFAKESILYNHLKENKIDADDLSLQQILNNYFHLAALVAAQPQQRDTFIQLYNQFRNAVKLQ